MEVTLSGIDALGNPVEDTASINLTGGERLTDPGCSSGECNFLCYIKIFVGTPTSCEPKNRCQ